ncbi:Uncharacterised protein [BD1-7 clade bacterium]|uniref:Uncharacterized protein n=1 Tax=BD1-7 clade bacterium TaxID=2029982 RepID=A0A5S9PWF7_9GAMM|nr:Uncharacterised protein [BD1-7 clade bacterium]CAA0113196.1 Uncharacterised protein [BD1-7 clade bacterium]
MRHRSPVITIEKRQYQNDHAGSGFVGHVVSQWVFIMKEHIKKGIGSLSGLAAHAKNGVSSGVSMVVERVNGLPIFMSVEKSLPTDEQQYDEKHYFVVPFMLSPYKFALHTMRCLPETIPDINDLPKRRVFHFATPSAEVALREYMIACAKEIAEERKQIETNSLEDLANSIDTLDSRLTYGMLLVGGLTALVNPLVGAGIAIKAVLPGPAGLLNKHGIRPLGEKLSKWQLKGDIKKAEKRVAREFSEATTLRLINPILQELEFCLRTNAEQHDPLVDPNLADGSLPELENINWRYLTETAIWHVYQDVYSDKKQHDAAYLGPEDIGWLKTLFNGLDNIQ